MRSQSRPESGMPRIRHPFRAACGKLAFGTMLVSLVGCGEVRSHVTQIQSARFLGADSVLFTRHEYTWVVSNVGDGGSWEEGGHVKILKTDLTGSRNLTLLDFPSFDDKSVWLVDVRNGLLMYASGSLSGWGSTTTLRNLATGDSRDFNRDGNAFGISRGQRYFLDYKDVYDVRSGQRVDSLGASGYNGILFFDEESSTYIVQNRTNDKLSLAYWNRGTGALDPIRSIPQGVSCRFADGGKILLFREWPGLKFYSMKVSDAIAHSKTVLPVYAPPGYEVEDVLGDSLLLLTRELDFDETYDTLEVTDLQGNIKRKIAGDGG